MSKSGSPVPRRLRQVRLEVGLTQKKLGILAGIDESSASPRINQYERGRHTPDYQTAYNMMKSLGGTVAYLYASDDDMAELIMLFTKLKSKQKKKLIAQVRQLVS